MPTPSSTSPAPLPGGGYAPAPTTAVSRDTVAHDHRKRIRPARSDHSSEEGTALSRSQTQVRRGGRSWPGIRSGPLLLAVLCLAVLSSAAGDAPAGETGRVVRIIDGDSLIVRQQDGTDVEVRLYGIDAPEYRQPWSKRSRQALGGLVRDRGVQLEVTTIDAYGRSVAVVRRDPDGLDVGRAMVRLGHAWVYRRYTDDPTLIDLEDEARAAGRGLWSMPESERVPPWQWRRQNRSTPGDEQSR